MATQPQPIRPWFRLASIARPAQPATAASAPEPTPAPAPAPAPAPPVQLRPPIARPAAFRPVITQPTPLPESTAAPPPTAAAAAPPPPLPPPPLPAVVAVAPATDAPAQATAPNGVASVPTSPAKRVAAADPSASLTTSPAKTSPIPTVVAPVATIILTSSVPLSSKPRFTVPSYSVPPSPVKTVPAASPIKMIPASTSVTTSPARGAPVVATVATAAATVPAVTMTREPSPKPTAKPLMLVGKSPSPESSKPQPTAPPPSPLTLPPSQIKGDEPKIPLEAEPKTVLVQKTINDKRWTWLNSDDAKKEAAAKDAAEAKEKLGHRKKLSSDLEEGGMRVITVAGENKGAFMEVVHSPSKKNNGFGVHHPYYLHKQGAIPTATTTMSGDDSGKWHSYRSTSSSEDHEGSSKMKDKKHNKAKTTHALPTSAFMNSNVQGVNNSIVYNSSCSHHDPGVHVALSRKPPSGGFHMRDFSDAGTHR